MKIEIKEIEWEFAVDLGQDGKLVLTEINDRPEELEVTE
jgi:hypothetical protein